jgi:hypothetical protein
MLPEGRRISCSSAFVIVKHALILDECFVAVFFAAEPVATNKWQRICRRLESAQQSQAATMVQLKEEGYECLHHLALLYCVVLVEMFE